MRKLADLHIHTNFSDGTFTPKETMAYAKKQSLDCIAIADHDSITALAEAIVLQVSYKYLLSH